MNGDVRKFRRLCELLLPCCCPAAPAFKATECHIRCGNVKGPPEVSSLCYRPVNVPTGGSSLHGGRVKFNDPRGVERLMRPDSESLRTNYISFSDYLGGKMAEPFLTYLIIRMKLLRECSGTL